ncbi:MAG: hypothetical protein HONBIEJF_01162 [Fimbriimonadaceae bacterium]|nr:hypothetical protein [Fimbriimonadaceae bacterium]
MKWGAVIAAGGTVEPELAAALGSDSKALARFNGVTSLERTLAAVRDAGLGESVTVGPAALREHVVHGEWAMQAESALDNILLGISRIDAEAVLMMPADTPLFSAESLTHFTDRIRDRDPAGDWFAAGASPLPDFTRLYPEAPVQAVRLREGRMVVSGMYAATPSALRNAVDRVRPLIGARKSQLQVISRIGPAAILKFLFGRLASTDVEAVAGRLLGAQAILIPDVHPATCLDVDTIADYHAVQAIVARTEPTTVRVEST